MANEDLSDRSTKDAVAKYAAPTTRASASTAVSLTRSALKARLEGRLDNEPQRSSASTAHCVPVKPSSRTTRLACPVEQHVNSGAAEHCFGETTPAADGGVSSVSRMKQAFEPSVITKDDALGRSTLAPTAGGSKGPRGGRSKPDEQTSDGTSQSVPRAAVLARTVHAEAAQPSDVHSCSAAAAVMGPTKDMWTEVIDRRSGHKYYAYMTTGKTQWEPPAAWQLHPALPTHPSSIEPSKNGLSQRGSVDQVQPSHTQPSVHVSAEAAELQRRARLRKQQEAEVVARQQDRLVAFQRDEEIKRREKEESDLAIGAAVTTVKDWAKKHESFGLRRLLAHLQQICVVCGLIDIPESAAQVAQTWIELDLLMLMLMLMPGHMFSTGAVQHAGA